MIRNGLAAIFCLAISIGTYLLMITLENGSRSKIEQVLANNDNRLITVNAGTVTALANRGGGVSSATSLHLTDMNVIQTNSNFITRLVPVVSLNRLLEYRQLSTGAVVTGTTPDYLRVKKYNIEYGRFIENIDVQQQHQVVVLGNTIAKELFSDTQYRVISNQQIVGKTITIGKIPFKVIGVLAAKGASAAGIDQDDNVYIPLSTAMNRVFNVDYISRLFIETKDINNIIENKEKIEQLLGYLHYPAYYHQANENIITDIDKDFEVLTASSGLEEMRRNNYFVSNLFKVFTGITTLISAAGIFAVTYLNITERKSEIGLRMAVGAKWSDIVAQVLSETLRIGIYGGLAGLLWGYLAYQLFRYFSQWSLLFEINAMVKPFIFAVLLTMVIAIVPAIMAARMNPVDALNNR